MNSENTCSGRYDWDDFKNKINENGLSNSENDWTLRPDEKLFMDYTTAYNELQKLLKKVEDKQREVYAKHKEWVKAMKS